MAVFLPRGDKERACPEVVLSCRRAGDAQCGMAKRSKLFINFFKHVPEVPGH